MAVDPESLGAAFTKRAPWARLDARKPKADASFAQPVPVLDVHLDDVRPLQLRQHAEGLGPLMQRFVQALGVRLNHEHTSDNGVL
jgi:hypothetical protein